MLALASPPNRRFLKVNRGFLKVIRGFLKVTRGFLKVIRGSLLNLEFRLGKAFKFEIHGAIFIQVAANRSITTGENTIHED